jgi:hypothetical protein
MENMPGSESVQGYYYAPDGGQHNALQYPNTQTGNVGQFPNTRPGLVVVYYSSTNQHLAWALLPPPYGDPFPGYHPIVR